MNINLSVKDIIRVIGSSDDTVSCCYPDSFVVKRVESLETAGPEDLAVIIDRGEASVFDDVSAEKIKKSAAGLILTHKSIGKDKKYILVKDALVASQKLVAFVQNRDYAQNNKQDSKQKNYFVHESAVVSSRAQVGGNSVVHAHVFIGHDCKIGSNVTLYPGVKVLDRCIIGDNTIVHANTVIGSDGFGYRVTKQGLQKIPQIGIVRIGNHVEIGANCSLDRAAFDETVISDLVKIDNSVHIAHGVKIGTGTAILAQTGIAGSVTIGLGCQIGGQVAIKNDIRIGNGVKIVSKIGVMHNLKDGAIVCGIPAISFSRWKRLSVILAKLPELFKNLRDLQALVARKKKRKSFWSKFFGQ